MKKQTLVEICAALAIGTITVGAGILLTSQHSTIARYVPGIDAKYNLEGRCEELNAAGISLKVTTSTSFNGEGNMVEEETKTETRWTDCKKKDGSHTLKEFSNWGIFEAEYEFKPAVKKKIYQGGWISRLTGADQTLPIPEDCANIINVGKSGGTKYIVCESPDKKTYMREFSDWGVFEATYIFDKEGKKDLYQGGWFARLGGKPQTLPLSKECKEINSAGRSGHKKYVDCILENGDHMLQEFTDHGIFEANYIFSHNTENKFYQGGWLSRLGGDPQMLKLPEECTKVINVGRQKAKTVTCETNNPNETIMKEYSDWGFFEATHRFKYK